MASQEDRNKAIAIEFFGKGINDADFEVIARLLSPVYTYNGQPSSVADNEQWITGLHQTYPGLTFTFDDVLAEGDKVAFRWRLNAPANGARPAGWMTGTNIVQIADGMIISNFQNSLSSDSWTKPAAPAGAAQ